MTDVDLSQIIEPLKIIHDSENSRIYLGIEFIMKQKISRQRKQLFSKYVKAKTRICSITNSGF